MSTAPEKTVWTAVPVPSTNVTVYEAIYRRRMAWSFLDKPVPRESLERMLSAAVWAPNHRMTEPWRFVVLEKGTPLRERVGELAYCGTLGAMGAERAEAYRRKVTDPPVVMFVYNAKGPDDFVTRENYAATVCAIQNMALAGVAEDLAVTWETGRVTRVPGLAEALGARPDWEMVTMLTIGFTEEQSNASRTPAGHFTRWA